jgi:hypothetical protein
VNAPPLARKAARRIAIRPALELPGEGERRSGQRLWTGQTNLPIVAD